jgi:hypothetical protein
MAELKMTSNAPFLAQLCGPAKAEQPLPPLTAGHDGLLRRAGVVTPFIDELQDGRLGVGTDLSTIVTKAAESPDPDFVRASWGRAMTTEVQKLAPDPDLIRHARRDGPALSGRSNSGIDWR